MKSTLAGVFTMMLLAAAAPQAAAAQDVRVSLGIPIEHGALQFDAVLPRIYVHDRYYDKRPRLYRRRHVSLARRHQRWHRAVERDHAHLHRYLRRYSRATAVRKHRQWHRAVALEHGDMHYDLAHAWEHSWPPPPRRKPIR